MARKEAPRLTQALYEEEMEEIPFKLSLFLNVIVQVYLIFLFRRKVVNETKSEDSAKRGFIFISIPLTFLISIFGYYVLSESFTLFGIEIFHGHAGIAFVLPFIVNIVTGFLAATLGKKVIGWKKMIW